MMFWQEACAESQGQQYMGGIESKISKAEVGELNETDGENSGQ